MKREEKKLPDCLLQSNARFPQKDILVCGLCLNRSDMVGNLADKCHNTLDRTRNG